MIGPTPLKHTLVVKDPPKYFGDLEDFNISFTIIDLCVSTVTREKVISKVWMFWACVIRYTIVCISLYGLLHWWYVWSRWSSEKPGGSRNLFLVRDAKSVTLALTGTPKQPKETCLSWIGNVWQQKRYLLIRIVRLKVNLWFLLLKSVMDALGLHSVPCEAGRSTGRCQRILCSTEERNATALFSHGNLLCLLFLYWYWILLRHVLEWVVTVSSGKQI